MSDTNVVVMTGNLTRDPELNYTPKGVAVASMGLASNRRYRAGNDEFKEEVHFLDVTVFGSMAEAVAKYLDKGRKVLVEGRLRYQTWDAEDGGKRSRVDVVAERVNFLPRGNRNGDEVAGNDEVSS